MNPHRPSPEYLFEVSWEVCNKIGGIHTVVSSKAPILHKKTAAQCIYVGPDVWRESHENAEFITDETLYGEWRENAKESGINVRIGRWNIEGEPMVILVDFSTCIPQKDKIFSQLWEDYQLDSLTGQWDYTEPALFGWMVGKVIESFVLFNLSPHLPIVAHFHEWMTGAGLLYLKKHQPQIGTLFTTHATVLGRSLAGNMLPLYKNLHKYDPQQKSHELGVMAKQSLESITAKEADAFTTVSEGTGKECKQFLGKEPDIITPNGFQLPLLPPREELSQAREMARNKLFQVTQTLLGYTLEEETLLISTSGRYEYKNKGIDIFLESLAELNSNKNLKQKIVAFLFIPANHYGPREDLQKALSKGSSLKECCNCLTHYLHDMEYDPIVNKIKELGLENLPEQNVKVIFIPAYLKGNDGILNISYYDILPGMDMCIFPSYYEPWGYTPQESLAYQIPSVTTSLAGFGQWIHLHHPQQQALRIIKRTDDNAKQVVQILTQHLVAFSQLLSTQVIQIKQQCRELVQATQWENFISYYQEAYQIALSKASLRKALPKTELAPEPIPIYPIIKKRTPTKWRQIFIHKFIPEKLQPLEILAKNLWWCWNQEAIELFRFIGIDKWRQSEGNPVKLLELLPLDTLLELELNTEFLEKLEKVYSSFNRYMAQKEKAIAPKIAYFSMEFGLHHSLKIYSGGLGILAGDFLKQASDSNVDMVGVGLFYQYGYFKQLISPQGKQESNYENVDFTKTCAIPLRDKDDNWQTVSIVFPGRTVHARIWRVQVGRVDLYLLDSNNDLNNEEDRYITHQLYGGDNTHRLKQELLLGIGGIRALEKLDIHPDLFHCNEGHAAFIGVERLSRYISKYNFTFQEALEIVRASSLFTTHTPVPAGHDAFPEELLRMYVAHFPERLNTTWEQFISLGKANPEDAQEKFSMSFLAAHLSQETNGVSRLHGFVSQHILGNLYPGLVPQELPIGYVTNGVHHPTWTAKEWRNLYRKYLGDKWPDVSYTDSEYHEKIQAIPDSEIWETSCLRRKKLYNYMNFRMEEKSFTKYESPRHIFQIQENFKKNALTIGFARRFASYKRAHLLFKDMARLSRIINHPQRPVHFIFAGKAHPHDTQGIDLIQMIIELSKKEEFLGKILFIQNYDMQVARLLVQGVDIWLNTPTRPLEASGTSGMKAVMNGVLHFSVLDGWWAEGYREGAGWSLPLEKSYQDQTFQDDLDAQTLYSLLENEIVPQYYKRDKNGIPVEWIKSMKNSLSHVAPRFSTFRMMQDYQRQYYTKLFQRSQQLSENNFKTARDISTWKKKISRTWESLEIKSFQTVDNLKESVFMGIKFQAEVAIDLKDLSPHDIILELLLIQRDQENKPQLMLKEPFYLDRVNGHMAHYGLLTIPTRAGAYEIGVRMRPQNSLLPHNVDFNLVKWV